jgi:hypothetical protein
MERAKRLELIRLILQVLGLQLSYLAEETAGAHGSAQKDCPAPNPAKSEGSSDDLTCAATACHHAANTLK